MVLGEGASVACLERVKTKNALCFCVEKELVTQPTGTTQFQFLTKQNVSKVHENGIKRHKSSEVDAIVMHARDFKGDTSEYDNQKCFGGIIRCLQPIQWKIGPHFWSIWNVEY
jgi:hypothetical protein